MGLFNTNGWHYEGEMNVGGISAAIHLKPIRDWHAGQLAIAESRAASRARWSRVKLAAYPIGIVIAVFVLWMLETLP